MDKDLRFFARLLSAGAGIWTWQLTADGGLIDTDAPFDQRGELLKLFHLNAGDAGKGNPDGLTGTGEDDGIGTTDAIAADRAGDDGKARSGAYLVGSDGDLVWGMDHEDDGSIVVIGPVRYIDRAIAWTRRQLEQLHIQDEPPSDVRAFLQVISALPVVESSLFMSYLRMLHFCLHRETIDEGQIGRSGFSDDFYGVSVQARHDYAKVWQSEQKLLSRVTAGQSDLQALQHSSLLSNGVRVDGVSGLERTKVSVIVFSTLLSRTAMLQGVSPDVAYPAADLFIKRTLAADDLTTVAQISAQMYQEFPRLIRERRELEPYPQVVRQAMSYALLHLSEPVRAKDVAAATGYSPYYITRAFHQATGEVFGQWLQGQRLRRACHLLETTRMSVAEVAEACGFSSRRYFTHCFSAAVHRSPQAYRHALGAGEAPGAEALGAEAAGSGPAAADGPSFVEPVAGAATPAEADDSS